MTPTRRARTFSTATASPAGIYLVFFPAIIALSGPNWWLIAALVLLSPFGMRYWVLRGVPRTAVTAQDLIPVDRKARELAQSQAMGEPTLWFLLVAGILMAGSGFAIAIADGDWWAWLATAMFGALAAMIARQIVALRRVRR